MRPVIALLACLPLFTACKKEAPVSEAPQEDTAEVLEAEAPQADDAEPVEDEGKIEVTADVMDRFVTYWETELALAMRYAKEADQLGADTKDKDGLIGGIQVVSGATDLLKRHDAELRKAQKASGFTEAQVHYLRDLVGSVAIPRLMIAKGGLGGEDLAKQMRQGLAQMPPEQRVEAERQIVEMEKSMADLRNAAEARKEYGDAAVDAVIKHEARLLPLYERMVKNPQGK